jgi:hypothetical protein
MMWREKGLRSRGAGRAWRGWVEGKLVGGIMGTKLLN